MNATLAKRLDQILPLITDVSFLTSKGIGNELACYIFDYPAADELAVREHIAMMTKRLASHHGELKALHLNLLDVIISYLESCDLLDKTLAMQRTRTSADVLRALKGPLSAERIRDYIAAEFDPASKDLFLISGVGSAWPMLRAHNLLNCLHSVMGTTPLIMFYPGRFDGTSLRLFGRMASGEAAPGSKSYYRALILVPSA